MDYPKIERHPDRLDSWLARGGMTGKVASRQSPSALLSKLSREGIHHDGSIQSEYWMLSQFSISYWLELRSLNQRQFPDADHASASIRKALWTIDKLMARLTSDRSYASDMVWGQAEWLLHQTKPSFSAGHHPDRGFGRIPLSALRKEFAESRDASGAPCRTNYQRDVSGDETMIEETVQAVSGCLDAWSPAGKDYLLTEFLLAVRDRSRYYYGGSPGPRGIQVLGKRHYQNPASYGDKTTKIGKIMVTLSQGHREIWDDSPDCCMAKISWNDVCWVKNAKPGDIPATASQWLRVIKDGFAHDITPKGGFILDFEESVYSGASVLSADAQGGVWLERFDLKTRQAIAQFSLREAPPKPFPDWAVPFQQRWERDSLSTGSVPNN